MTDTPDGLERVDRSPRRYEENTLHATAGIGVTIQANSYRTFLLKIVTYDVIIAWKEIAAGLYSGSNAMILNNDYTISWGITPDEVPSAVYWMGQKRIWKDEMIRVTYHEPLRIVKPQCFVIRIRNNSSTDKAIGFQITGIKYTIE